MRAERLIELIATLHARREVTAAELARDLGVSRRTVYRDLDTLSGLGVPVVTDVGRGGGVRLLEGYRAQLGALSHGDAESLVMLRGPDDGSREHRRPVLDKLAMALPTSLERAMQRARERMLFDTRPWFSPEKRPDALDLLREAVWSDRRVRMLYERLDGRAREYLVEPYAIAAKVEVWYLVASTPRGMRVFRVSRVLHADVLADTFTRSAGFDLDAFWSAWTARFEANPPNRFEVDVRLTPEGARALIAAEGRRLERFLEHADFSTGSAELRLDLETEARALGLLFAHGDGVTVLGPAAFKAKLRALARSVLESA